MTFVVCSATQTSISARKNVSNSRGQCQKTRGQSREKYYSQFAKSASLVFSARSRKSMHISEKGIISCEIELIASSAGQQGSRLCSNSPWGVFREKRNGKTQNGRQYATKPFFLFPLRSIAVFEEFNFSPFRT